jgi:hypothetical protein
LSWMYSGLRTSFGEVACTLGKATIPLAADYTMRNQLST